MLVPATSIINMDEDLKPTDRYKGKKITIILPLETYAKLKERAERETRPLANLCKALLIQAAEQEESDRDRS